MKTNLRSNFTICGFLIIFIGSSFSLLNKELNQWSQEQNIPGYHSESWPPILLADRNKTIHAFSSQWVGEEVGSTRAIVYNQWTLSGGWTEPVDILLSPIKNDARLTDAFLDQNGMMHVVFWGGDNTDANIYYSSAPALDAGKISAWSDPILVAEKAMDPENSSLFIEDSNNLGILFSSIDGQPGLYVTYSDDGGNSWSNPQLILDSGNLLIDELQIYQGQSGQLNAIWNLITIGGQGREIYYSNSNIGDQNWREPIILTDAESGYGTQTPAIIEYDGELIVFNSGIVERRSKDGGLSWSEPVPIFRRHTGINGSLSPVIDGNGDLHLFFGQRISGSPDIHGMWHSVWGGEFWSEPEAVVSGPQVVDQTGFKSFDPFEARAVVSQGNVIMVTWRTDPGLKGNGVLVLSSNPGCTGAICKSATDSPIPRFAGISLTQCYRNTFDPNN